MNETRRRADRGRERQLWQAASCRRCAVRFLLRMTRDAPAYRFEPSEENGLKLVSQIMIEKVFAVPRHKCGSVVGLIDERTMALLDRLLAAMLGLAS